MAAAEDNVPAAFRGLIDAEAETDEGGIIGERIQHPGRSHRLDIERKRQPPPDAALVRIAKSFLVEKLSGNAPLHAKGLDEIMYVEPFGLRLVAAIIPPAVRIEDPNHV